MKSDTSCSGERATIEQEDNEITLERWNEREKACVRKIVCVGWQ